MNAVLGARTQTTLPLSPPQSNMAPPSEDNGKVKKDITKLPWRCAHHIRVIYTVNGMLLCLGYGCSSASPPFNVESKIIPLLQLFDNITRFLSESIDAILGKTHHKCH